MRHVTAMSSYLGAEALIHLAEQIDRLEAVLLLLALDCALQSRPLLIPNIPLRCDRQTRAPNVPDAE